MRVGMDTEWHSQVAQTQAFSPSFTERRTSACLERPLLCVSVGFVNLRNFKFGSVQFTHDRLNRLTSPVRIFACARCPAPLIQFKSSLFAVRLRQRRILLRLKMFSNILSGSACWADAVEAADGLLTASPGGAHAAAAHSMATEFEMLADNSRDGINLMFKNVSRLGLVLPCATGTRHARD